MALWNYAVFYESKRNICNLIVSLPFPNSNGIQLSSLLLERGWIGEHSLNKVRMEYWKQLTSAEAQFMSISNALLSDPHNRFYVGFLWPGSRACYEL